MNQLFSPMKRLLKNSKCDVVRFHIMAIVTNFGPKLSHEEYTKRIIELYSNSGTGAIQAIKRKEFDLKIDYRLGKQFPAYRRDELWEVQKSLQKKSISLFLKLSLKKAMFRDKTLKEKALAELVTNEYSKILSKSELESFLGEEAKDPYLPVR